MFLELEDSLDQKLINYPHLFRNIIKKSLLKIGDIKRIEEFLTSNQNKENFDFIDALFDNINFSYLISHKSRLQIPSEGRVIIIANHALGILDGMLLLKVISEFRKDVKIVVNDFLLRFTNMKDLFLPYNIFSNKIQRVNIKRIESALIKEEAVIFFPSGSVDRWHFGRFKDNNWHNGAFYFSQKLDCPLLPIHINATNSSYFYLLSLLSKKLSYIRILGEIFNKKNKEAKVTIGESISPNALKTIKKTNVMNLLNRHLFYIGKGKEGIFPTEINIIQPINIRLLKQDLKKAFLIGNTRDHKSIYLAEGCNIPNLLKEIGRLRELSFRKVGEGTRKNIDIDKYDYIYQHIILWDDELLEVIGAYRLKKFDDKSIIHDYYTSSIFNYKIEFNKYLKSGVELGRSFVNYKYWNSSALDYLWQGVGAFISKNSNIRYLFGGVSITNNLPSYIKDMIIFFYKKWYQTDKILAVAKNPYKIDLCKEQHYKKLFYSKNREKDFNILRSRIKSMGYSIPVLFKQYTNLCVQGGVLFLDFGLDNNFSNCIDGLILVDILSFKDSKRKRYLKDYAIK